MILLSTEECFGTCTYIYKLRFETSAKATAKVAIRTCLTISSCVDNYSSSVTSATGYNNYFKTYNISCELSTIDLVGESWHQY